MGQVAAETLATEGRVWFRTAVTQGLLRRLDDACALEAAPGARLAVSAADLAEITELARAVLEEAQPVRVVAFNKSVANNWTLPWHQDRVVAVRSRAEAPGFSNWTRKAGIWHAEPPLDLLRRMIFLRVHLDSATRANGCMQIALGSHCAGKVASGDAARVAQSCQIEDCVAVRGDVLVCHALLLHRSSPSVSDAPRRAFRIDFAAEALPAPLRWAI